MFLNVEFFDGHGTLIFDLLVLDVVAQGNQIFETGTLLF